MKDPLRRRMTNFENTTVHLEPRELESDLGGVGDLVSLRNHS